MANVCATCGERNRAKARFCSACAAAIEWPATVHMAHAPEHGASHVHPAQLSTQVCAVCKAHNVATAVRCETCASVLPPPVRKPQTPLKTEAPLRSGSPLRFALGGMLGAVVLALAGAGVWSLLGGGSGEAPTVLASAPRAGPGAATVPTAAMVVRGDEASPVPAEQVPGETSTSTGAVQAPPANGAGVLADNAAVPKTASDEDAARNRLQLQRNERERLANQKKKTAAELLQQEQAKVAARQQAQTQTERAERERATSDAANKAANPPKAQAPAASPEAACANSTNFVAREFCRFEQCRNPAFANDPICVRAREVEEERNRPAEN